MIKNPIECESDQYYMRMGVLLRTWHTDTTLNRIERWIFFSLSVVFSSVWWQRQITSNEQMKWCVSVFHVPNDRNDSDRLYLLGSLVLQITPMGIQNKLPENNRNKKKVFSHDLLHCKFTKLFLFICITLVCSFVILLRYKCSPRNYYYFHCGDTLNINLIISIFALEAMISTS